MRVGIATDHGGFGLKEELDTQPLKELQRKFGFEPDQVASAAKKLLGGR